MAPRKFHGSTAGVTMRSADALRQRPDLAAEIAVAVATWSETDHVLAIMLADLLEEQPLTLDVFFRLHSDGPKHEIINLAAESKLSPDLTLRISELIKEVKDKAKARNRLAHGLYGVSVRYPNELLWMDLENVARHFYWNSPDWLSTPLPAMVYSLADLKEITSRAQGILQAATDLRREVIGHLDAARRAGA